MRFVRLVSQLSRQTERFENHGRLSWNTSRIQLIILARSTNGVRNPLNERLPWISDGLLIKTANFSLEALRKNESKGNCMEIDFNNQSSASIRIDRNLSAESYLKRSQSVRVNIIFIEK